MRCMLRAPSQPCITYEARVLLVRRAGAGLELLVDSERSPHVHAPLLQPEPALLKAEPLSPDGI